MMPPVFCSGPHPPEEKPAHRVPPQMMGIIPNNTGGFGDVEKASRVFVRNELMPLQKRLQELNDWLDEEVIRFEAYDLGLKGKRS